MSEDQGGRLTTHVLDTAAGRPASGLEIALFRIEGEVRLFLTSARTNSDGRCDQPLLAGPAFKPGVYELVFQAGEYLRGAGHRLTSPAFIEEVPIRFGLAEATHYHVPLLLSPFGYSTYRGS